MSQPEICEVYKHYSYEYAKNLEGKGVKRLGEKSSFGQAMCCLIINIGKAVNINEIRDYVQKKGVILPGGGDSLQVRHLALQYGYNLLKGNDIHPITKQKVPVSHFLLIDLENSHPGYISKKRNVEITTTGWDELKKQYGNSCVNCGSKEGQPMRWNEHAITHLQQGHMNPKEPLSLGNIIPQCAFCNQQYKNKAIFNERGFVIDYNKNGFIQEHP